MEDAPEQLDVVVGRGEEVVVEEREADLVARAVHHDVGVHLAAVGEADGLPSSEAMFGFGAIVPWAMRSRMRPETVGWDSPNLWSGLGSP